MLNRNQTTYPPQNAPSPSLAPGQEASQYKRAPSVRTDVLVPLNQALLTAFIIALIPLAIGVTVMIFLEPPSMWWKAIAVVSACVFVGSLAKAWFWRLEWIESTILNMERMTGLDINGDGVVEDDEPPHFVSVNRYQSPRPDPVERERQQLETFVRYAFEHGTQTDTLLARFNRQEIGRFRALLMRPDVHCAEWNNARAVNQGWRFIGTQEQVLKVIDGLEVVETVRVRR